MLYNDILNIALIPEDKYVAAAIVKLSQSLNEPLSLYHLRNANDSHKENSSIPHCTVMHFLLPKSGADKKRVLMSLLPFVDQTVTVSLVGLEKITAPAFIKAAILRNQTINEQNHVQQLAVAKNNELITLQNKISQAIGDEESLITGKGPAYAPHFTLWVQEFPQAKNIKSKDLLSDIPNFFNCKVIIGSCGPIGQIERVIPQNKITPLLD